MIVSDLPSLLFCYLCAWLSLNMYCTYIYRKNLELKVKALFSREDLCLLLITVTCYQPKTTLYQIQGLTFLKIIWNSSRPEDFNRDGHLTCGLLQVWDLSFLWVPSLIWLPILSKLWTLTFVFQVLKSVKISLF